MVGYHVGFSMSVSVYWRSHLVSTVLSFVTSVDYSYRILIIPSIMPPQIQERYQVPMHPVAFGG